MKGIAWGELYNAHKGVELDSAKLEQEVALLMADEDVTKKSGIYPFVLDRKERHLNIRSFTDNQKREAYERQKGICPVCNKPFALEEMQADHITPWHLGGRTIAENCQMLCAGDNRLKSGI
jgi:5-methylcytosine-specific restriction endonuclease McrA